MTNSFTFNLPEIDIMKLLSRDKKISEKTAIGLASTPLYHDLAKIVNQLTKDIKINTKATARPNSSNCAQY